eukprot:gene13378-17166_t
MLVEAGVGEDFNAITRGYLHLMEVLIAFGTPTYGERTSAATCTYYELEKAANNLFPSGNKRVKLILPLKMCPWSEWPPKDNKNWPN